MYMLDLLGVKMYVVNDPRLLPMITKAHKVISFTPFVKVAAARIAGNSKPACDLFDGPLLHDYIHSIKMTLSPGRSLDEMNLRTGQVSVLEVKNLIDAGRETRVRLLEWARHAVVQASSCGIFGAEHPFRDMIVERAFW
jgi:hypothetical protein